jgi:hypothetical protein
MREIKIGDQTVRVRASALALFYFRQEFKSDLLKDLLPLQNLINERVAEDEGRLNLEGFDVMIFYMMIWAMAKADSYGRSFPGFEAWMESLGNFNVYDTDIIAPALKEATEGFFRGAAGQSGGAGGGFVPRAAGNPTTSNREARRAKLRGN